MNVGKRLAAGAVTAAFLGGALALAPTAAQASGTQRSTVAQAEFGAAAACYKHSTIGWYCGFHSGSTYTDYGDQGNKVKEIQKLINDTAHGPNKPPNIAVDGKFGDKTLKHVKWFQKAFMGADEADGKVGPKTWKALRDK
ncbi:peptidoglycan-binding domain-containing protein [Streptomyces sp. T-3]|nr:peptidoglycan-binding domain-containing protein [Streptomyces sp. T-3]